MSLTLTPSDSHVSTKAMSVSLTGPFQNAGAGELPHFALQLDLQAGGHTLRAGATSTGSALFVELAGTWFAAPESVFSELQKSYAQATKSASSTKSRSLFASLGIEPSHWLSNPVNAGTATIGGVQTDHLTAGVNTAGFLADISKFSKVGGALGSSSGVSVAGVLSPTMISELVKSVKSAHVDIYTGQSDHLLRRLQLEATVSGTSQTKPFLGGLSSANVKIGLEFSNLNRPQTILAPTNAKPFSQLLPALIQLFGLSGGSTSGANPLGSLLGG